MLLNDSVNFVPFYINRAERTCRTQVFARSTSDALLGIYRRNLKRLRVRRIGRYHCDGSCRTMAGTVPARLSVGERNATVFHPYGMTDLGGRLLCLVCQMNGIRGAYFRTFRTFGTTIATFVRHYGLHECIERSGRTEHFIGAN